MHAPKPALVLIPSLALSLLGASSAAPLQSETTAETVVGYVVGVDGDALILSNIPTVAPGQVISLGGGQMFLADPEGGEVVVAPGKVKTTPQPMILVRAAEDPKDDRDAADGKENKAKSTRVVTEPKAAPAGGTWVMEPDGGKEMPETNVPLEIQQLRMGSEVAGRELLIPGLQVRLHFTGEGDSRVVTRVELVEAVELEVTQQ